MAPPIAGQKAETPAPLATVYGTGHGRLINARIEDFLESAAGQERRGTVDLIVTSPPFPRITQKKYGNETGEDYLN